MATRHRIRNRPIAVFLAFAQRLTVITAIVGLGACSSMLYFPTHQKFYEPTQFKYVYHDEWITTDDGHKLHGWYFSSKAGPAKALVVHFHGNAENITTHFLGSAWLSEHGFDVFIFDYRGYGLSDGKPSPRGTVLDGLAVLRWAQSKNSKLIVWAQSLGGAVGQRTLIENKLATNPVTVRGALLESTFSSYEDAGRGVLSHSAITWLFQPLAYLLLNDRDAPGQRVAELAPMPLLVVHGDHDTVVDVKLGRKLFKYAAEPKDYWEIPGGQHIDAFWANKPANRERLLVKFNEWLK